MSDLSGWAQAGVAGVAIIASGMISTYTIRYERKLARQEENRRRLDITTKRWPPAGLQLDIRYLPEFTHVGMFARIKRLSPEGATLKQMYEVQSVAATSTGHTRLQLGGPFIGDSGIARLVGHGPSQPFTGAILMLPPLGSVEPLKAARIEVTIETDAGEVLLRAPMGLSPVDEVQSFWEMSPVEGSSI